jgi:hypothetical protein
MSPLEDEIRDTLRSAAAQLDLEAIRPLHLPPAAAPPVRRALRGARRARWLRAWQGPLMAVALVVLVAATLVTLKSVRNEPVATSVASASAVSSATPVEGAAVAAGSAPRYYVAFGSAENSSRWAIIVGDRQTGKTLATYTLQAGGSLFSAGMSGAADDRTFVVSADPSKNLAGPPTWYLVRIFPGAAHPVRVTKLPVQYPAGEGVKEIALSADGTELAVVSTLDAVSSGGSYGPQTLETYSVATGQRQHSWSAGFSASPGNLDPVAGLSWVGDHTVGFAVTYSPEVREQVRTLGVSQTGSSLLADSRLVWSQYVPASPSGTRAALHVCDTPFLTGNGQAVVCGNFTKVPDGRLTAVWLAYPLAAPAQPRVIGSIQQPPDVSNFNGQISVEWANPSGTEMIGSWNTSVGVTSHGLPATEVTNYAGVMQDGEVTPFPRVAEPQVAW